MALSIDGSVATVNSWSGTTSKTVTLTTPTAADIILVAVQSERTNASGAHATITSLASANLPSGAWSKRASSVLDAAGAATAYNDLELWWAYSSGALTSEVITITANAAVDDASVAAWGVTGFTGGTLYQTAPWDQNAALPAGNTGSASSTPTTTAAQVSTTNANTMLLYLKGSTDTQTGGIPAGFNNIANVTNGGGTNNSQLFVCNQVVSATQSGITIAGSGAVNGWLVIADALSQTGGAAPGGSPLRRNSSMDGLGASGGFFSNPLARSVLGWRPSIVTARRKLIVPRHAELRLAA